MRAARGLAAAAIAAIVLAGCGNEEASARPARGGGGARPVAVRVETIRERTVGGALSLVGEIAAPESVEVASEIAGRLERVAVDMGERVEEGALLVEIDDSELRAQLTEAGAAVEVSRAAVKRAQAELRRAETEHGRKAPLAADDLVTRQEMDEVETRLATARASLMVAEAQTTQAAAKAAVLRQKLRYSRVRAPFDGWVEARSLDPGAVVSPGATILRLVRTDPAVARFMVTERHVGRIRSSMSNEEGVRVSLRVPAFPSETWEGQLARISPTLDPSNRAAAAEAEFPNADGRLMPGMYSKLKVHLGGSREAVLAPLKALVDERGAVLREADASEAHVFVVAGGDLAELRPVSLGEAFGSRAEVMRGLQGGERVVVEGQSALRDGATVRVVGARQENRPTPPRPVDVAGDAGGDAAR